MKTLVAWLLMGSIIFLAMAALRSIRPLPRLLIMLTIGAVTGVLLGLGGLHLLPGEPS